MQVKRVFRGVPNGQFHPVTYRPGDRVPPELVAAALAVGADQEAPATEAPPQVKAQTVSQMRPDGKIGRGGGRGGKGIANSPPPPPPPPPPPNEPGSELPLADPPAEGEGASEAEKEDGEGSEAAQVPASDDPSLGGLG